MKHTRSSIYYFSISNCFEYVNDALDMSVGSSHHYFRCISH